MLLNMKNTDQFIVLIIALFVAQSCQKDVVIPTLQLPKCGRDIVTPFPLGDSLTTLYETSRKDYHNRIVYKDSLGRESFCWLTNFTKDYTEADFRILCRDSTSKSPTTQQERLAWNNWFVQFINLDISYAWILTSGILKVGDTTVLYSRYTLVGYNNTRLSIVIERDKPIKQDIRNQIGENYNFVADTTIQGKKFRNLYFNAKSNPRRTIFFEQKKGVVIVQDSVNTWVFDRFE
jgi:hypothetical protein